MLQADRRWPKVGKTCDLWRNLGRSQRQQGAALGQHRQTTEEVHANLSELLDWQFAERNDQAVAQALHRGQGVDAVYGLAAAGLWDGFSPFWQKVASKRTGRP